MAREDKISGILMMQRGHRLMGSQSIIPFWKNRKKCVKFSGGWSDLGDWNAVAGELPHDGDGNYSLNSQPA